MAKMTCEPASEAKAEHSAMKKLGKKASFAKHVPMKSTPKRTSGGR